MKNTTARPQTSNHSGSKKIENVPHSDKATQQPNEVETEQPKFLTGWVPVVKIFNTRHRAVRLLWIVFTASMVVALVSSISVVVHRYLSYVTVVRLDQQGPQEGVGPPVVTLCLPEHETDKMHISADVNSPEILSGISRTCDKDFALRWDSKNDAVSNVYSSGGHFAINLRAGPVGCYTMKVYEQVPYPPNSICTSFELEPVPSKTPVFWKLFAVTVELTEPHRNFTGRPLIIVHEPRSFPLDNFGRYLYEYIKPGFTYNVFYSKTVTKRLNTRGKPCRLDPVRLLGHEFDYDQVACQWHTICHHYHTKCGCLCPLDVMRRQRAYRNRSLNHQVAQPFLAAKCPDWCHHNHPIALVNSSTCPLACHMVAYKKLNHVEDDNKKANLVRLVLIQAEGLTEMIEEELYSLPKLFSEIGGLSSFCFGFSCMLFFELIELAFWLRCTYRPEFALNRDAARTSENTTEGQQTARECLNDIPLVSTTNNHTHRPHARTVTAEDNPGLQNPKKCSHMPNCMGSLTHRPINRYPIIPDDYRYSHRIALHPLKICRVDGHRLSEYPSEQDSPIFEMKRYHRAQEGPMEKTDPLLAHLDFFYVPSSVQTFVGSHHYDVPIDVKFSLSYT
ncbi:hypothetical protein T265_05530 [Opisthorchis viverrini]|uniref:Amiloride-sensitive sodium channel n=2 Tax=Opisthorchis viverrini TaxID=6198 RepID=A0A075AF70_OPIVI|nr:hypothetical protein T265_05530 [Opisthorchis viverrini]KER27424.1 hypothetical protein T265_05530 [Opisthorchis viverrini]